MNLSAVTVLIEYRARPDQIDRALDELEQLVATVVASETDCYGIRLLQEGEEPTRILLDERWSSREAYLGPHFETAHLKDFIARAAALFEGPPTIRLWTERAVHARGREVERHAKSQATD